MASDGQAPFIIIPVYNRVLSIHLTQCESALPLRPGGNARALWVGSEFRLFPNKYRK